MAVAIPVAALAYASIATAAVGTATSIYASEKSSQAQQQTANYNAQVAKNNATLASQNSIVAGQQNDVQVQALYARNAQAQSGVRAAMAANGIDLNSGSALDVQDSLARTGQQDVQNLQYSGNVSATNYLNQAISLQSQAGLDTATGQQAAQAGNLDAASTFITGALERQLEMRIVCPERCIVVDDKLQPALRQPFERRCKFMAKVPISSPAANFVPTVMPSGMTEGNRVTADPSAFGALQAQALRGLGSSIGQAGDTMAQVANQQQAVINSINANNGLTELQKSLTQSAYGDQAILTRRRAT